LAGEFWVKETVMNKKRLQFHLFFCLFAISHTVAQDNDLAPKGHSEALRPGTDIEISFDEPGLPPTLYSVMNGTSVPACLTYRLPEDYSTENTYPLVVYVPGNDGNIKGNIHNAKELAGSSGWIAATLPLFKKSVDRSEFAGGVIVSFEDYPVIAQMYALMLGRLFERVPNIDRDRSAMVGFSNGAITIAVLLSNHDEFVLSHFKNFCIVDQGMFHLTDLHKCMARDCRFLVMAGDQEDLGRDLKLRQCKLLEEEWKLLNVNLSSRILKNTGHTFEAPQMEIVRDWLREGSVKEPQ
jgi:predicted esterase